MPEPISATVAFVTAAYSSAVAATATVLGAMGTVGALGMGGTYALAGAIVKGGVMLGLSAASAALLRPNTPSSGTTLDFKPDPKAPIRGAMGYTALGGNKVFQATWGYKRVAMSLGVALSLGPIDQVPRFEADGATVTFSGPQNEATGFYAADMWQRTTLGLPGDAALLPPTGLKYGNPGLTGWGAQHAAPQVSFSFWTMVLAKNPEDRDVFTNGVPDPRWIGRWMKLWDPRKDSTYPGGSGPQRRDDWRTWEWSESPYVHALAWCRGHYKLNLDGTIDRTKRIAGIGAPDAAIDIPAFVEGMNVAQANNWTISGEWSTSDGKFQTLLAMLQAGGGEPISRGAQISVLVNAPRVATYSYTRDDLIGQAEIRPLTPRRERKNTIVPRYKSEANGWQYVPAGEVTSDVYRDEDRGEPRSLEIEYTHVRNAKQAGQLAAYDLANLREGLTATLPSKVHLMHVHPGDCITVDVPELALAGQKFVVRRATMNHQAASVTLELRSESDGKHAWALGQAAQPAPSPSLSAVDPKYVPPPAPGDWTVVPKPPGEGGISQPIVIIELPIETTDIVAVIIKHGPSAAGPWTDGYEGSPRPDGRYEVAGLTPGQTYCFSLQFMAKNGAKSEPDIKCGIVAGDLTAGNVIPTAPTIVSIRNDIEAAFGDIFDVSELVGQARQAVEDLQEVYGDTASAATSAAAAAASEAAAVQAKADAVIAKGAAQTARDAAATKATEAAGSASDALTSKNDAAASATTATQKATDAAGSAATATQQAGLAAGSATAAGGSATAAAGSASTAATKATEAGNSATAANAAKVAAESARDTADQKATAAASSAASAATSSTQAGQSASAAQTAKTDAETARAQAQTSASNAADAATNAAGSAATASSAASQSVTAKDQAQGFANAANTSAQNAAGSATAAGNSASAANTSKTAAEAAYGASLAAAMTGFPDRVAADLFSASSNNVAPLSRPALVASKVVDGWYVANVSENGGIYYRSYIPWKQGEIYELTAEVEGLADTGTPPHVRLYGWRLNAAYGGPIYFDASATVPTPVGQKTTVSRRIGMGVTPPGGVQLNQGADGAWFNFGAIFNRTPAGNTGQTGAQSRIRLSLRNVTAQVAAETSASASATSAASAAASATLAGEKATAAQNSATAADTSRGQAQTAASQASQSETNAAGSAASASSAAQNAATSRDQASGFATAASGSASTASTKATEAGNSASAAAASQVSATAAKDAAVSAAVALMPDVIAVDLLTSGGGAGAPASKPNLPSAQVANGAFTSLVGTPTQAHFKAVVPWKVGEIYEVTIDVEGLAGSVAPTASPYALRLNSSYSSADTAFEHYIFGNTPVGQTTRRVIRFGLDVTPPAPSGGQAVKVVASASAAFVRFGALFNYGSATDRQSRLKLLTIRNVTTQVAAESSATAAATSASSASASATTAGEKAASASGSAVTAATKAGEALSYAYDAATSAANAQGAAESIATSIEGLEARTANTEADIIDLENAVSTEAGARAQAIQQVTARQNLNRNLLPGGSGEQGIAGWSAPAGFRAGQWPAYGGPFFYEVLTGLGAIDRYYVSPKSRIDGLANVTMQHKGILTGVTGGASFAYIAFFDDSGADKGAGGYASIGGAPATAAVPAGATQASAVFRVSGTASTAYAELDFWQVKLEGGTVATIYSNDALEQALSASVTQQALAIIDLENQQALAAYELIANASGSDPAYLRLVSSTAGGYAALASSVVALQTTSGGQVKTALRAFNGNVHIGDKLYLGDDGLWVFDPVTKTESIRGTGFAKVRGRGFGANGDLTEWSGPNIAIGAMTKANGVRWEDVNGNAYFGGSLSAGVLTNKASTSSLSFGATTETARFGSNGGSIKVTLSLSGGWAKQYWNPTSLANASENGNVVVTLYRSVNGGAFTAVATLPMTYGWTRTNQGNEPGLGWSIAEQGSYGASLTYTDPQTSTQDRQYRATITTFSPNTLPGALTNQNLSIICVE